MAVPSLRPVDDDYTSVAVVAVDGSARIFGVSVKPPDEFGLFRYYLSPGGTESRAAQIILGILPGTAEGSSRQLDRAEFSFGNERTSLSLRADPLTLPAHSSVFVLKEGTYRGRVFLLNQTGIVDGFGTVTGKLTGKRLDTDWRVASQRTDVAGGRLVADTSSQGAVSAVVVQIGGGFITSGVTWSSDGSRLVLRVLNEQGQVEAWVELQRQ